MIGRRGSFSFATLIANGLHAATAAVLLILATPGLNSAQEPPAPVIRNAGDIPRILGEEYPTKLVHRGIEGAATVEFRIDRKGKPQDVEVVSSTGVADLDKAARDVAGKLRFEPPESDEEPPFPPVRVPIEFRSPCGEDPGFAGPSDEEHERLSAIAKNLVPKFVLDSLRREHVTVFDVVIDEVGRPRDVKILVQSGYSRADDLGAKLLREARFKPVEWDGDPVPARFRRALWLGHYLPMPTKRKCTEETRPRVSNLGELAAGLADLSPVSRPGYLRRDPVVNIYLDRAGYPVLAYVERSSCWPELDRELLALVKYMQIRPARCDGKPEALWVAQPIDLGRHW